MKNTIYRIFWGIFFLACAGYAVASQMGILHYELSFWSILGTIIFALSLIDGLLNLRITESIFSIAFLLMIYAGPLHITRLVPWTILLAALLISIGLEIIFHNRFHTVVYANKRMRQLKRKRENFFDNFFTDQTVSENSNHVVIEQRLSDSSRYINSQELESIDVTGRMSDMHLYLNQTKAASDEVNMHLDLSMSSLTIYLPLSWQIENNLASTFAFDDLEIDGSSNGGGPTLVLSGKVSMSEVKIEYV